MKNLLKNIFNLWIKICWIKAIERQSRKQSKFQTAAERQEQIVSELTKKYNEMYVNTQCNKECE